MKLEKVNDNKLQIKINKTELSKENISINDIETGKPNVEKFFYSILENSIYCDDFLCGNSYLYIEITTKGLSEFTVGITKVPSSLENCSEKFRKSKNKYYSVSSTAYLFESTQDLLSFVYKTQNNKLFVGRNTLYCYNNKPLLVFSKSTIKNPEFIKTFLFLSEYCRVFLSKPLEISALLENASLLNKNSAIQNISNHILA